MHARRGIQQELQLGHGSFDGDLDAKLAHFGKFAQDALDRTWKDIYAAHHEHVVGAAEDAIRQAGKRPSAGTWRLVGLAEVAGPIANQWHAGTAKIGRDELTLTAW